MDSSDQQAVPQLSTGILGNDDGEDWIKKINNNSWKISWDIEIEKLSKLLDQKFDYPEHKTVSYILMDKLQKIPERWESVDIEWVWFFIEKMNWNKIESIRIQK